MVTSSTTGSGLNQQTSSLVNTSSGEGNTIVLFKPDDQQLMATNINQQQQELIDRSTTKMNITSHTISSIDSSSSYQTQQQQSLELKEENLDQSTKINVQPPTQQQRQHHNLQINSAIIANRNLEILSAQNEHVLFKAASSGDTASIAQLLQQNDNFSLLTLDSQGASVLHHAVFNGHLDMIQFLLRQDCSKELLKIGGPNYTYRCSVLHLAARLGNQTICSVLLAAGSGIN